MPVSDAKLYLLPGLGGDSRLFVEQRRYFGDQVVTPEFIAPRGMDEPLESYARRWLEQLAPTPPYFLGGMSFGGMIAMEMARAARPAPLGVFLIGSCRSSQAIRRRFGAIYGVGSRLPRAALRAIAPALAFGLNHLNDLTPPHARLVRDIARDADLDFVLWGGRAALTWANDGSCPAPVHQIHGARDLIIPMCPGAPDAIITTGRHLIQFSHADIVNHYLDQRMTATTAAARNSTPATAEAPMTSGVREVALT